MPKIIFMDCRMRRMSCGIRRRLILLISIGALQPRGSGLQKPVPQITLIGSSGFLGEYQGPLGGITRTSMVVGSVYGNHIASSLARLTSLSKRSVTRRNVSLN